MTERELLKRLVRDWDRIAHGMGPPLELSQFINEARVVLASTTDPEPEHPAVVAYQKWCNSMKPGTYSMAEGFLAGWRQALLYVAKYYDVNHRTHSHLISEGNSTPTHLP